MCRTDRNKAPSSSWAVIHCRRACATEIHGGFAPVSRPLAREGVCVAPLASACVGQESRSRGGGGSKRHRRREGGKQAHGDISIDVRQERPTHERPQPLSMIRRCSCFSPDNSSSSVVAPPRDTGHGVCLSLRPRRGKRSPKKKKKDFLKKKGRANARSRDTMAGDQNGKRGCAPSGKRSCAGAIRASLYSAGLWPEGLSTRRGAGDSERHGQRGGSAEPPTCVPICRVSISACPIRPRGGGSREARAANGEPHAAWGAPRGLELLTCVRAAQPQTLCWRACDSAADNDRKQAQIGEGTWLCVSPESCSQRAGGTN